MGDKIYAFTASLPGRSQILEQAVYSITRQVDAIHIVCNNFPPQRWMFLSDKFYALESDNSLFDGSRFINMDKCPSGYVLVFDDDIIYPENYVQTLIAAHHRYKGIICPMGKVLKPRPIQSYYKDIILSLKTFSEVPQDTPVQVPGVCGALWHTDEVKLSTKDMIIPNSDLCVAKYAKDNNIRCTVVKHESTWLKNLWTGEVTKEPSIYGNYRRNDEIQTDFVNQFL